MQRIIGLDIGTKRIGIAVSDPLFLTAQPLTTISRQPEQKSIEEIEKIVSEYQSTVIIVGLPRNMDGSLGYQAEDVQNYAALIREKLNIEIIFIDERLTSKEAERILIEQNKKPSKNKGLIDVASAAIILQQYLDGRRNPNVRF